MKFQHLAGHRGYEYPDLAADQIGKSRPRTSIGHVWQIRYALADWANEGHA